MVVEPADTAVTTPDALTVAIEPLAEDQVMDLFVALDGRTVAVNVFVDPVFKANEVNDRVTEATETVMVTTQAALYPPHAAVIVAEPAETAVTTPDALTVAFAELDVHVTVLLVALDGATVAIKERVLVG